MKTHLLISAAIGAMLATGAFAQSPSEQPRTNSPAAAQSQTNSNSSTPASSIAPSSSSTSSSQSAQSAPSGAPTTTSQSSTPNTNNTDSTRSQAQSNQASPAQARTDQNPATAPSQTQNAPQPGSSSQAQTNTAPPANTQTQPSSAGAANANNNAAAQPSANAGASPANNQTSTAQSRSANVNVSANLSQSQRTRVSESITRLNARPVTNVNFSLSVGTVVPRDVHFQPLPADVVEILPQYRGYDFVVVREDIVIVEPSTHKIVDVLPRASHSTAAASTSHKTTFSDRDREVIRRHARARTEQHTTGSATSTHVRVGDRLPDSVEIRSFPDEVYRESPTLREYRYIERDDRTYVVEPHERTIIEEID